MAEQKFHCDHCDRDFATQQQLDTHNREQHSQQAGSRQTGREAGTQSERGSQRGGRNQ